MEQIERPAISQALLLAESLGGPSTIDLFCTQRLFNSTNVMCAGHLYASNDYEKATELARELILDEKKRKAMAAAARAHVEKLGWMAAVKRIRDTQYQRAINTFRAHKRSALWELQALIAACLCLYLLSSQPHPSNQLGYPSPQCSTCAVGLCCSRWTCAQLPQRPRR